MLEKFLSVVSEISKVPIQSIRENLSFRDDLGVDSLQFVNLLLQVSSEFDIELGSVQSIEDLKTVGDMYAKLVLKR